MANVVEALVSGGKATAGPPLGPALGPLGVNVAAVVAKINELTKDLNGMQVPVKIIVKSRTEFEIEVGTPPTSALLLKEAGVEKGSGDKKNFVGDISMDQVIKVAEIKRKNLLSSNLKSAVSEIVGTCGTLGIKIDGLTSKEVQKALASGSYDHLFEAKS
ncbi:LSU ribosomal protein L11P [Methanothrix thermoacetophila PT]|uniref:Large ribosomal subunit protein uL11 n=1 Tax=Methanothrix thermoacetophila (strain DSM 6194 / JCM 14653 / NBRC 101360 / PT) TaxID=349307 RepID=RL11_METTP|nr:MULTISPECIES: 50S ribosomal protein L11 [Methanothrix]A0B923.1 RecName: Full=Large ribosomal subunit protein uL11; AltName: Full=50S ribosomal protein L11 [Methanothrix thermoacetophila PT]ABK15197.1 LSU ribosomal protein L11P [Methanothrix thermoacetophila PT]